MTCRRQRAKTIPKPPPPPLPAERVQWKRPFNTVGVDHTGHFCCRDVSGKRTKLYICLFVCVTTRAVHLEVVNNLSTPSFLLCLRHLAAAKGIPSLILSDNRKTFISGEKFLLALQEDKEVQEYLRDHRVQWKHQTLCSPWMGGHFERLVRTIKTSLSSAIARKLYNQEEFTTIVEEVENIINSRPLTYQASNAWSALREKHENRCTEQPTHHIKPGSLVMIRHENLHRHEWPLGKVTRIFPDPSGIVRTAEVEERGQCSLRPVTFLVPLKLDCCDKEDGRVSSHRIRRRIGIKRT